MKQYDRVYAAINLDAIISNIEQMESHMPENTKITAVIKTDGYGHGAVPVAEALTEKQCVWGFAVATADEAFLLRKNGIKKPILVLGCVFPEQIEEAIQQSVRLTIYNEEVASYIIKAAQKVRKKALVHIKIDTGMARIGFTADESSANNILHIVRNTNLISEGIYTHFAKADEEDKTYTKQQVKTFREMIAYFKRKEIIFPLVHCSNSAGIIDIETQDMNMVRAGIAMYGLYPSAEVTKSSVKLIPALELKSKIIQVREIPPNTSISYGGTYISQQNMKIATIPVGYGDGYPRSLSNKGYVLIHGEKAPILGRICMDQFMVDVTHIQHVKFGDIVTLIGQDGDCLLSMEVLSELSGRFNYEFVCDLGKRIPRVYMSEGKIVSQIDYFN